MGYDEAGAAFHHFGECVLDLDLGTGIDGGGCLIEDQHGRQAQHDSGDTQKLFLSLGQAAAVFGDHGVIPLGQSLDKAMGMGCLGCYDDLSSVASGLPMQMLSRIVPERNQVSCSTIP